MRILKPILGGVFTFGHNLRPELAVIEALAEDYHRSAQTHGIGE
jgi:hypothetical protein